jgi:hypothetical protein
MGMPLDDSQLDEMLSPLAEADTPLSPTMAAGDAYDWLAADDEFGDYATPALPGTHGGLTDDAASRSRGEGDLGGSVDTSACGAAECDGDGCCGPVDMAAALQSRAPVSSTVHRGEDLVLDDEAPVTAPVTDPQALRSAPNALESMTPAREDVSRMGQSLPTPATAAPRDATCDTGAMAQTTRGACSR